EAAERARQMRDVSRMLDAMEAPVAPASPPAQATARRLTLAPAEGARDGPTRGAFLLTPWAAAVAALALVTGLGIAWRRRRVHKQAPPSVSEVSIATHFASAPLPTSPEDTTIARPPATPDWTYKRTAFEAPTLQLTLEPVDLLSLRPAAAADPSTDTLRDAPGLPASLVARLHPDGRPTPLYLSGDQTYPSVRHVGTHADDFLAWEQVVREMRDAPGADGLLARWLLPALLRGKAALLERAAAQACLDEALARCRAELEACAPALRPWWRAHLLRTELARLRRLTGASRLLALRELGSDEHDRDAPVLDAWIDIHLAWSGWLVGMAARTRLDHAEATCSRLADIEPVPAMRRRAEILLCRANLEKGDARLLHLDNALGLLESVDARAPDPATSLLIANGMHQRAALLPPDAAAEACSAALGHAFSAGQHPAWHIASLEVRLAIQATYDGLPGHRVGGDVAAVLRRELTDARSLIHRGTP
ncbi:hypothetical protein, partial [Luteibacter sp.]|uniref:hypothetical protein n=1 Tax=Luteibacter sp. TaxID=1886636 RepID=UPI003F7DEE3B